MGAACLNSCQGLLKRHLIRLMSDYRSMASSFSGYLTMLNKPDLFINLQGCLVEIMYRIRGVTKRSKIQVIESHLLGLGGVCSFGFECSLLYSGGGLNKALASFQSPP